LRAENEVTSTPHQIRGRAHAGSTLSGEAVFVDWGIFMKERATPLDVEHNPEERRGHQPRQGRRDRHRALQTIRRF
jgi:hypothetical protein